MKEITPNPTDMSKPTSEEKNKQLPKALRGLIKLLDDGDLVRNTDGDADITVFMLRSVKIINAIRAAQEALIESTNQDSTTSLF